MPSDGAVVYHDIYDIKPANIDVMRDSYISYGNDAVTWVQSFRSEALDSLFKNMSYVADVELLIIIAACVYWIVDKRFGFSLMLLFLFGSFLNLALKGLLEIPRPSGPQIAQLSSFTGYALPSAHAQNATTFGLVAARTVRHPLFWAFAIILVLSIAIARVYLGAHYPGDVILGILSGVALVSIYSYLTAFLESRITNLSLSMQLVLIIATIIPCILWAPTSRAAGAMIMFLSFNIGWAFENRYLNISVGKTLRTRALQAVIGITGLGLIVLSGSLIESVAAHDILLASALGFWITLGAPSVFLVSGIARHRTLAISS
jgi:membrane-associated phospholipid phosphatase